MMKYLNFVVLNITVQLGLISLIGKEWRHGKILNSWILWISPSTQVWGQCQLLQVKSENVQHLTSPARLYGDWGHHHQILDVLLNKWISGDLQNISLKSFPCTLWKFAIYFCFFWLFPVILCNCRCTRALLPALIEK